MQQGYAQTAYQMRLKWYVIVVDAGVGGAGRIRFALASMVIWEGFL